MSLNMAELVSAARQELTTAELAGQEESSSSSNEDVSSNSKVDLHVTLDDRCLSTESRQISVIMSTSEMIDDGFDSESKENDEMGDDLRKKPYGGRPLKFQCPHCDRRFHAPSHLKRHVMSHSSERPYRCDVCGKGFLQAWHLGRHMTTHTGNKPFRCSDCPKSFGSRFEMKTHINYIHKGIKEHQCDVCGKYFTLRSNLKVHMRKHTGEKPYQCTFCSKRFGQRGHLQYHIRKHTGSSLDFLKVPINKLNSGLEQIKSAPSSPVSLPSPSRSTSMSSPGDYCHDDSISLDSDKDSGVGGCDSDENSSTTSGCHSPSLRDFDEQQISCDNFKFNDSASFLSNRFSSPSITVSDMSRRGTMPSREIKPFVCHSCNCGFAEVSSLRAHVRHSHPRKGISVGDFKCGLCLENYNVIDHLQSHVLNAHRGYKSGLSANESSKSLKRNYDDSKSQSKVFSQSPKAQAFSIESLCKKDIEKDHTPEKRIKTYLCNPLPYRYASSICSPNLSLPWYPRFVDKTETSRSMVKYYEHLASAVPKYGCDSLCPLMASRSHCFQIY